MWSAPYDLSVDIARADALFASVLQISDEPSAVQVKQAIDAATSALGDLGRAAQVAEGAGRRVDRLLHLHRARLVGDLQHGCEQCIGPGDVDAQVIGRGPHRGPPLPRGPDIPPAARPAAPYAGRVASACVRPQALLSMSGGPVR